MMAKKLNYSQACCSLYLVYFDFMLVHCLGCSIEKPDMLSQRLVYGTGTFDNKNIILLCLEMFAIWALEDVELKGTEKNMLSDICKDNHNRDQEEPIAWTAHKLQQSLSQTVYSME